MTSPHYRYPQKNIYRAGGDDWEPEIIDDPLDPDHGKPITSGLPLSDERPPAAGEAAPPLPDRFLPDRFLADPGAVTFKPADH